MQKVRSFIFAMLALGSSVSLAHAAETITYSYDARGRLVKVVHSGSVNNNVQTSYDLDKADNRTAVKTTGAAN